MTGSRSGKREGCGQERGRNPKGAQETGLLLALSTFIILIVEMVSCVYTHDKTSQTVHVQYVHFKSYISLKGTESLPLKNMRLRDTGYFKRVIFKEKKTQENPLTFPLTA